MTSGEMRKKVVVETESSKNVILSSSDEDVIQVWKSRKACLGVENVSAKVPISMLALRLSISEKERIAATTFLKWIAKDGLVIAYVDSSPVN